MSDLTKGQRVYARLSLDVPYNNAVGTITRIEGATHWVRFDGTDPQERGFMVQELEPVAYNESTAKALYDSQEAKKVFEDYEELIAQRQSAQHVLASSEHNMGVSQRRMIGQPVRIRNGVWNDRRGKIVGFDNGYVIVDLIASSVGQATPTKSFMVHQLEPIG